MAKAETHSVATAHNEVKCWKGIYKISRDICTYVYYVCRQKNIGDRFSWHFFVSMLSDAYKSFSWLILIVYIHKRFICKYPPKLHLIRETTKFFLIVFRLYKSAKYAKTKLGGHEAWRCHKKQFGFLCISKYPCRLDYRLLMDIIEKLFEWNSQCILHTQLK